MFLFTSWNAAGSFFFEGDEFEFLHPSFELLYIPFELIDT